MKALKMMVVILLSLTITTAQSQGIDDPLLINNLEDLNAFRDAVNLTTTSYQGVSSTTGFEGVYFKITADIDMSSINNWEPMGSPIFCFYGNLDGDNHVISNIRIVYPTMEAIGFFRYCMAGSVENLHFEGGTIQGSSEVGTICGNAMYTQFNNCSSTANVIGTDEVGQLLGRAFDCAVSNCTNLHDISGNEDVGGICGSGSSTSFQSCINRGNVSGTVNVGGICGNHSMFQNMGNIVNCKNYGNIDVQEDMYGNSEGGGIIGRGSQSILNNCINFGNVFGIGYSVGGMAGRLTGTCENCINMGRIQGGESVYGIANEADAYRCINGGPIIGEGFRTAGITNSNIAYACVNTGDIYGSYDVGGIISSNLSESNHYYDCINAGNVFGSGEDVGAICGLLSFMGYNVENCYWDKQMCNTLYGIGHQESSEGTEPRLTTELTGFALQSAFNAADWVFTEGLYPYPAGFNNPEIARLAVSPIFLHHSITGFEKSQLILSDFDLTIVDNNQWTSVANKVAISGNHATLIGTGYDTLCVSNNEGITKQIPIIVNPLGTILNPLTIDNEQDLCDLSQAVNNFTSGSYKGVLNKNDGYKNTYFALTADLDMKSYEMAPIGIFNFPFRGNFNGKNHTINNLTIHQSGTHVALFGALEYGVIDSLNMMNFDISGESWVASIAGYADESMIRNCHAFGNIHGNNNFTGGICGQIYEESTIFHCTFGGIVDGFRYAGGITAGSNDSWIKRCINLAEVNGDLSVGGIIGLSNGNDEVLHCFNAGTVTAHQNKAGGIIGNSFLGVYESNVNVGAVYCDQLAGGIYAYDTLSQYANCFYDNQMCIKGGCNGNDVHSVIEGYNTLEMVGEGLRNKLGIENWNFQSNLYPMVTLIEAKDAGKVARTPIFLQNQENVTLVTADFSVATENEVSWSSDDQNVIAVEGDIATLTGTGEAVLTASKNNIYKTIQLTTQFTAIEENAANTIQVYPNPAQNQVNVYGDGIRNIKIINQIGHTIFITDNSTVDVTRLNNGIYFFEIETERGVIFQKVVVSH